MTASRNPDLPASSPCSRRSNLNLLLCKPFNRLRFYRELLSSRQSHKLDQLFDQSTEAVSRIGRPCRRAEGDAPTGHVTRVGHFGPGSPGTTASPGRIPL